MQLIVLKCFNWLTALLKSGHVSHRYNKTIGRSFFQLWETAINEPWDVDSEVWNQVTFRVDGVKFYYVANLSLSPKIDTNKHLQLIIFGCWQLSSCRENYVIDCSAKLYFTLHPVLKNCHWKRFLMARVDPPRDQGHICPYISVKNVLLWDERLAVWHVGTCSHCWWQKSFFWRWNNPPNSAPILHQNYLNFI